MTTIQRALISVSDKTGIIELAQALSKLSELRYSQQVAQLNYFVTTISRLKKSVTLLVFRRC